MFTGIVEERGAVREVGPTRLAVGCATVNADSDVGRLDRGERLLPDGGRAERRAAGLRPVRGDPRAARRSVAPRPRRDPVNLERPLHARDRARRPPRPGPRRRGRRGRVGRPRATAALGCGPRRPPELLPLRRGEGLDRRGRRQPDGRRGSTGDGFAVALIPHTLARTTLGDAGAGRPREPRGGRHRASTSNDSCEGYGA